MSDRTPPHDMAAERSTLGSVFIAPERAWSVVSTRLVTDSFLLPAHREIFEAMAAVVAREMPLDTVTVGDELKARGALARLEGGEEYLLTIAGSVPTAENVEAYSRIVHDLANQRRLIQLCASTMSRAYGAIPNADDLMEEHMGDVARLAMGSTAGKLTRMAEIVPRLINTIVERVEAGPEKITAGRITTGVRSLDEITVGFDAPDLVIIGGDPGSGKTALAVQAGLRLAIDQGGTCLCVNLEMSADQIGERALGNRAKVNSYLMRSGRLSREDLRDLYSAGTEFTGSAKNNHVPADFYIEDKISTVREFEALARTWRMRHPEKVALAIFDYLQLADAPEAGRHQTRAQQVSNDCRRLKRIAKSLGITIIAPSSLKRDSKKIAEKPPVMDDLKESGDVEYAADTILLLWNRDRKDGPVDLIVEKNKKGPTATLQVMWMGKHYKFSDLDDYPAQAQLV